MSIDSAYLSPIPLVSSPARIRIPRAGFSLVAAGILATAVALSACAAPPVARGPTDAPAGESRTGAEASKKPKNLGYRQVVRNGQEYFCQVQGVTGSRTKVIETCLTKDQLALVRDSAQDFHGDVTRGAGNATAGDVPTEGGSLMGPMPMSVYR